MKLSSTTASSASISSGASRNNRTVSARNNRCAAARYAYSRWRRLMARHMAWPPVWSPAWQVGLVRQREALQ